VTARFHPAAEAEYLDQVRYYEECRPGLGGEFVDDVRAAIARATDFPRAWTPIGRGVRRCLLSRFPFGIFYIENDDGIFVVAVASLHRRPGYWRSRLSPPSGRQS